MQFTIDIHAIIDDRLVWDHPAFQDRIFVAPNGCWVWLGAVGETGYGQVRWKGRLHRAHRLALEIGRGRKLRASQNSCHSCDFPGCVRPSHCFAGTQKENMQDAVRKCRMRVQKDPSATNTCKLTSDDVRTIRQLDVEGISRYEIAERFGVVYATVYDIVRRRSWKHIQ